MAMARAAMRVCGTCDVSTCIALSESVTAYSHKCDRSFCKFCFPAFFTKEVPGR